jgi:hypothetical protein
MFDRIPPKRKSLLRVMRRRTRMVGQSHKRKRERRDSQLIMIRITMTFMKILTISTEVSLRNPSRSTLQLEGDLIRP